MEGKEEAQTSELVALHSLGLSDNEIARRQRIPRSTVSTRLRALGLDANSDEAQRHVVGELGELAVMDRLEKMGLSPVRINKAFDIECHGARIDVKAARPNHKNRLHWNLHSQGYKSDGYKRHKFQKSYADDCDFLVFVWLEDDVARDFWVIPVAEIGQRQAVSLGIEQWYGNGRGSATYEWLRRRHNRFDIIRDFVGGPKYKRLAA